MTQEELGQFLRNAKDPDLFASLAAMERAAVMARSVAIQTGTAIVVVENGQIVRRTAVELQRELPRYPL